MESIIRKEIIRFVLERPEIRLSNSDKPYLEEPLIGFASRGDPLFNEYKKIIIDSRVRRSSNCSERHAAYAAGLGTFSLNDGFITEKGIAHRCRSIITNETITPTKRTCPDPWCNCLYCREGTCGICLKRCPVGAISNHGHYKEKCQVYFYGEVRDSGGNLYGVMEPGCGLCQTKVPSEYRIS